MAETDGPLKRLASQFSNEFAAWLLRANVRQTQPLNTNLPGAPVAADQVFQATLASGQDIVLHIEFQGRRSRQPMPWRMLDYMTRLAAEYRLAMHSVVLYVGRGAGTNDRGIHQVEGIDDLPALSWRYGVVRLWQMSAQELMALGSPALLALVGQTHIDQPEVVFPEVIRRLRQIPEVESRSRLLTEMLMLIDDQEMEAMVERLIDSDELLLDTPFLRRLREESREEGREEGKEEGREEGREEGELRRQRQNILQAITLRLGPPDEGLITALEQIRDADRLEALFTAAIQSAALDDFRAVLDHSEQGS
ncbi:MAG: hypothetical protein ETSY1_21270 [Candidatus Entotheonella factor]|uniref:Transposase (putative) YhgA-like domain-containing protein n=1 Tax=Entotheonella factor TaxID=1429438 RepID=W4LI93_ENTF1|nr:hypothetical protein [Candidatus Entotheonella palauensis]ETW97803.1 MAG: hypothetical protein ETSY1_21270 [Candidatus Entotheonella factor]